MQTGLQNPEGRHEHRAQKAHITNTLKRTQKKKEKLHVTQPHKSKKSAAEIGQTHASGPGTDPHTSEPAGYSPGCMLLGLRSLKWQN